MAKKPLYQVLAAKVAWQPPDGTRFAWQRAEELNRLVDMLPSGSGWDTGTKLSEESRPNRLAFYGSFHHMNDVGYYDGWTDHTIVVTPSLAHGFELRITGRDRNDVKDLLHEWFDAALRQEVEEWAPRHVETGE